MGVSSPRVWGCFPVRGDRHAVPLVFPTRVGVFLYRAGSNHSGARLPHACGGVSQFAEPGKLLDLSSPRVWGCFLLAGGRRLARLVFPTRVGVFLADSSGARPRSASSPRVWGCFCLPADGLGCIPVFPTRVGVFLGRARFSLPLSCLPHACGGVSKPGRGVYCGGLSSPRVWGCFIFSVATAWSVMSSPRVWGCFI